MNLRSDTRQNVQLTLDFRSTPMGEARKSETEAVESRQAAHAIESPASTNRLMEEVCDRANLKEALRRVKANKGSPGIDGMTTDGITDYLKQHWPAIREQLLSGTYEPKPVRRVEIPKPDGVGVRKFRHSYCAGPIYPASGNAGLAEAVGPDVLRAQLWLPAGTLGSSSSSAGAAVYRRKLQLDGRF